MKVIEGGFEQTNHGDASRALLEESGVFEDNVGFLLIYQNPDGGLKMAGCGFSNEECVMALEMCKQLIIGKSLGN